MRRKVLAPLSLAFLRLEVGAQPGAYLLCDALNRPIYSGRSEDLVKRLQEHLPGSEKNQKIADRRPTHAWFKLTEDIWQAYLIELNWYQRYRVDIVNEIEPAIPAPRSHLLSALLSTPFDAIFGTFPPPEPHFALRDPLNPLSF